MKIRLLLTSLVIATTIFGSHAYYNDHYSNYNHSPYYYQNNNHYYDYNDYSYWDDYYYDDYYTYGNDYYWNDYNNYNYNYGQHTQSKPLNSRWVTGCEISSSLCEWVCLSGYVRSGNRCIEDDYYWNNNNNYYDDYYYDNHSYSDYSYYDDRYTDSNYSNSWSYNRDYCELETVCGYKNGIYAYYASECSAEDNNATIVQLSLCEPDDYNYYDHYGYHDTYGGGNTYNTVYNNEYNYQEIVLTISNSNTVNQNNDQANNQNNNNYQDNHNYNYNCNNGTTNYPYCTTCPTGETYIGGHCVTQTRCQTLPANAYWYSGNGNYEPNCAWKCQSGYQKVGSSCVQEHCSNGATNYPNCNFCPTGQIYSQGQCMYPQSCPTKPTYSTWKYGHGNNQPNCEWQCNSGYVRSGNTCIAQSCSNGATNYPYCNTCPSGTVLHNNQCVHQTYNWYTSGYSTCSASCGGGVQTRTVECRDNYGNHVSESLCSGYKPSTTQSCNTHACHNTINGSCGSTNNTCYQGTLQDTPDTGDDYKWQCNGLYGGSTAYCSAPKYTNINGACGYTTNTCAQGTFQDVSDTSTAYKWQCSGLYGGSTAYCSTPKQNTGINGSCGQQLNTCTSGQFIDQTDTSYNYKWRCAGINGGTTQDCTITKQQYSWHVGDYGSCSQICGGGTKTQQVYCKDSNGYRVADSLCSGTKPTANTTSCNTQGCLMWVNTDGYSSCNTVCGNAGKKWVKNKHGESCASGVNRPSGVTSINYRYGVTGSAGLGGSVVYNYYNECFHCYKDGQTRAHKKENWLVACLCQ